MRRSCAPKDAYSRILLLAEPRSMVYLPGNPKLTSRIKITVVSTIRLFKKIFTAALTAQGLSLTVLYPHFQVPPETLPFRSHSFPSVPELRWPPWLESRFDVSNRSSVSSSNRPLNAVSSSVCGWVDFKAWGLFCGFHHVFQIIQIIHGFFHCFCFRLLRFSSPVFYYIPFTAEIFSPVFWAAFTTQPRIRIPDLSSLSMAFWIIGRATSS